MLRGRQAEAGKDYEEEKLPEAVLGTLSAAARTQAFIVSERRSGVTIYIYEASFDSILSSYSFNTTFTFCILW